MKTSSLAPDLVVRTLEETDVPACAAVVESVDATLVPLVMRDLSRHFSDQALRGSAFFVAEAGGELVGMMGMYLDPDEDVQGVYWAVWLYVRPSRQHGGIGSALIDRIEQAARERGARKLYLDVGNPEDQPEAIRFYDRRRYALEGRLRDYFRPGEDKLIYAIELGTP